MTIWTTQGSGGCKTENHNMVSTQSLPPQCSWPETDKPKILHSTAQPEKSLEILTSLFTPGWAQGSSGSMVSKEILRIYVHQCQSFHEKTLQDTEKLQNEKAECVFHKVKYIHLKGCPSFCFSYF